MEFHFGQRYNSVALISDSIDFLEDASINLLIVLAIGWSEWRRRQTSYLLALLLLVPGLFFLWNAVDQLLNPVAPDGSGMSSIGVGALLINIFCALLIAKHRHEEGGLVMAAYFSARNDAVANLLIIGVGVLTLYRPSVWPDLVVGLAIFLMNADAAKQILNASHKSS